MHVIEPELSGDLQLTAMCMQGHTQTRDTLKNYQGKLYKTQLNKDIPNSCMTISWIISNYNVKVVAKYKLIFLYKIIIVLCPLKKICI